jgi:hypothetical protein
MGLFLFPAGPSGGHSIHGRNPRVRKARTVQTGVGEKSEGDPKEKHGYAKIQAPPKEYREVPFWSWNDELDPAELRRQIALMDQAG